MRVAGQSNRTRRDSAHFRSSPGSAFFGSPSRQSLPRQHLNLESPSIGNMLKIATSSSFSFARLILSSPTFFVCRFFVCRCILLDSRSLNASVAISSRVFETLFFFFSLFLPQRLHERLHHTYVHQVSQSFHAKLKLGWNSAYARDYFLRSVFGDQWYWNWRCTVIMIDDFKLEVISRNARGRTSTTFDRSNRETKRLFARTFTRAKLSLFRSALIGPLYFRRM